LWLGFKEGKADATKVIETFKEYMRAEGHRLTAGDYEKALRQK